MLDDATLANIRMWLSVRFGPYFLPYQDEGELIVAKHGLELADYHGVYVWQMGGVTLVSAPEGMVDGVCHRMDRALVTFVQGPDFHGRVEDGYINETFWRTALGERVARIIGPAYQGFCDMESFQPADTQGARPLTLNDHRALRAFIAACPPEDWQDSAISPDHLPLDGLEREGALVALASAPSRAAMMGMRSVGVVTLPAARGTGAGRAVVSALIQELRTEFMLLRYQTLRANLPSVAIARRLGFEDVATTLAVRLR
ncbi:MAG TPA: GNAT family N-acetyltransferase [Ktedonobacterales bacterium]|jgi:GNAT superfamily N-acetyltransferase|nr:GNAT family N-acetyltransferase [Ktedonobacterales bacterium]